MCTVDLRTIRTHRSSRMADPCKVRSPLRNSAHFPRFIDLPNDRAINHNYYFLGPTGQYQPVRHWCFLGEITNDEFADDEFSRNCIKLKDVSDSDGIPVFFYGVDGTLDFSELQVGITFCLRYAQSHFLDSQFGIRCEHLDEVLLIPANLPTLLEISDFNPADRGNRCWSCDSEAPELLKCSRCKLAHYCGKSCQGSDWTLRHKRWCRALPKYMDLVGINYNKWEGIFMPFAHT